MKPYYEHAGITIYHGDCREILPDVTGEAVICDPVWPNSLPVLAGADRPYDLLREALNHLHPSVERIVIQLGCVSDPRFLAEMEEVCREAVQAVELNNQGKKGQ